LFSFFLSELGFYLCFIYIVYLKRDIEAVKKVCSCKYCLCLDVGAWKVLILFVTVKLC